MEFKKQIIDEFEYICNMAKLKILSKLSLEKPLSNNEFKRIMELKKLCLDE